MLDTLRWTVANWIAGDLIGSCGTASYEIGYEHGYHEAAPRADDFREEFKSGYEAGQHDAYESL